MPNASIPATAEGLSDSKPEDMLNEARDMCSLIFMAISSMQIDNEIRAISAGVYDLEKKLEAIAISFETNPTVRKNSAQASFNKAQCS